MKREERNLAIIIVLILIILIIITFIFIFNNKLIVSNVRDFESCKNAGYPILESFPRQCKTPDGKTFIEEIKIDDKNKSLDKNYCTSESRKGDVCITLYEPVCGWFDPEKIQCIKYPCAETFSNSCFACLDEKVLYWTDGECPG